MPIYFNVDDLAIFLDWVESFEIQSGMNDNEEFAGRFLSNLLSSCDVDSQHHNLIKRQLDYLHRGLYTGYDGTVPKECTKKILAPLARDLIDRGWNRRLNQVKLKFGELRFYIQDRNENYEKRILNAMIEWNDN